MTAWYEDTHEITRVLEQEGLPGMHRICKARRDAYYEGRRPHARSLIFFGRFLSDTCGNLGKVTEPLLPALLRRVPAVMDVDEFEGFVTTQFANSFSLGWRLGVASPIPFPDEVCGSCGKGWTLEDMHDFVRTHAGPVRHGRCHDFWLVLNEERHFRGLFDAARIPIVDTVAVPNGYDRDGPPWFSVHTPKGVFDVGWRKRVIMLSWEHTTIEVQGADIVAGHEITHGPRYCHCWGPQECIAALVRLREHVEATGGWA